MLVGQGIVARGQGQRAHIGADHLHRDLGRATADFLEIHLQRQGFDDLSQYIHRIDTISKFAY